MKNKILPIMLLSLFTVGCTFWGVRGNGKIKSETRSIENFRRIDVSGCFTVKVQVGEQTSLKIKGEENLLPLIKTHVRGNTLILDTKKNLSPRKELLILITTPELENLDCSGANDILVEGIKTNSFEVDLSGACSIDLIGLTEKFIADLSGAGSINAKNLEASRVYISVSGAASANVFAKEFLDASVSGVGSIDYYGNPKSTNTSVSGIGSISRK
jgi:hypothetical protein